MIVRAYSNAFVLIEQDNHAQASAEIISYWRDDLLPGLSLRKSLETAIARHDIGWRRFDRQPFWNDLKQAPYTFSDFPVLPKTVLYQHGIDEVEKEDSYAALLCSEHYKRFMIKEDSHAAQDFVEHEKQRQQRISRSLNQLNKRILNQHYTLIQLADSLSLYACINDPGASKENEHPFFRDGISISDELEGLNQDKLSVCWKNDRTIALSPFPFTGAFNIYIKQKTLSKQAIAEKGLIDSYETAPFETICIQFEQHNVSTD